MAASPGEGPSPCLRLRYIAIVDKALHHPDYSEIDINIALETLKVKGQEPPTIPWIIDYLAAAPVQGSPRRQHRCQQPRRSLPTLPPSRNQHHHTEQEGLLRKLPVLARHLQFSVIRTLLLYP
ncbi:hypothetical protein ETB97_000396 [Aspergillus alliaceus]|uniref:Uncharacterized protein n=1 Tax=Petromyces alliaceus TaxID=209559 RepID=A0A8H6A654_PETAA|nr:hypothetical protein ETB97_000396 [Aspergillus burnettii]